MPASTEKRFRLKSIDCAACAAKMENRIRTLDGVEDAVIDFASLTLHLKARDMDRVLAQVRLIEPAVELESKPATDGHDVGAPSAPAEYDIRKEAAILTAAALIFAVLLIAGDGLQRLAPPGLEFAMVLLAYLLAGWNVLGGALRTLRKGMFFDENVLMVIATTGAIAIQAYTEAIGVMIFYKVGEMLQAAVIARSRRSIRSLLAAKPDRARIQTTTGFQDVPPESVGVGETILVKPGEKIPLDGTVIDGKSQLDTSALTGESVPLMVRRGDTVLAGQINTNGALTIRVSRIFNESSIAKVMTLVEHATARKAQTEQFITVFARYYTPVVVMLAAGIALLPPLLAGGSFATWTYRALVLLVISCPCALVVSVPLGYFGGIGRASRSGILVKGSNYIDALAGVDTVMFDKTGTLTEGVFEVRKVVSANGFTEVQLLEFAAAAELHNNHPIAAAILYAYTKRGGVLQEDRISHHQDFPGQGVSSRYGDHLVMVGNDKLLHRAAIEHGRCEFDTTVAHIVVDGGYAGYLLIGDGIRADAGSAIQALRKQGVERIKMLTGDNASAAEAVARKLELNGVYADLLPEDKVRILEEAIDQQTRGRKVAYVGDGVNDAPVIARADVGVAMGALGSDAAIETADVVLMKDSPMKMAEAISIARRTRTIVWQNIALVFVVKGIFIGFGAIGLASMWAAVFADMGTALLALFNATRILKR